MSALGRHPCLRCGQLDGRLPCCALRARDRWRLAAYPGGRTELLVESDDGALTGRFADAGGRPFVGVVEARALQLFTPAPRWLGAPASLALLGDLLGGPPGDPALAACARWLSSLARGAARLATLRTEQRRWRASTGFAPPNSRTLEVYAALDAHAVPAPPYRAGHPLEGWAPVAALAAPYDGAAQVDGGVLAWCARERALALQLYRSLATR